MTRDDALLRAERELRAAMDEMLRAGFELRPCLTRMRRVKSLRTRRDRIAALPPGAECDERGYLVSRPASRNE